MIAGLIVCVGYILHTLDFSITDAVNAMEAKDLTKVFNTDVNSKGFFIKQIIGGMFITIAMTGLDQEMMQKNISVKTLKDSQKTCLHSVSSSFLLTYFSYYWAVCFISMHLTMAPPL